MPLQGHAKRGFSSYYSSTVIRAAIDCPWLGAECVEPAILASVRILRTLRDLVDDDGRPTADESKVFNQRGELRGPVRKFLEALNDPVSTLDKLAKRAGLGEFYVRTFSKPLQNLGLIRLRSDGRWVLTTEGAEALKQSVEGSV